MTTQHGGGQRRISIILSLLQVALAAAMAAIAIWKPYVLGKESQWLGPTETVFLRNPILLWLIGAELLLLGLWIVFVGSKSTWQWVLAALTVAAMVFTFVFTNHPPVFMG